MKSAPTAPTPTHFYWTSHGVTFIARFTSFVTHAPATTTEAEEIVSRWNEQSERYDWNLTYVIVDPEGWTPEIGTVICEYDI